MLISSLTATYEKLLDVNSYKEGEGLGGGEFIIGGYTKITREGYEGSMECDSRWVPCGFELFQNVHLAALVMCPANVNSLSVFYFKQMLCSTSCLPSITV